MEKEEAVTALQAAVDRRESLKSQLKDAKDDVEAAAVEAMRSGAKPAEVADVIGVSYETVRRLARAAKLERLREPTVTSRKRTE